MDIIKAAQAAGMNGASPVVIGSDSGRGVTITNAGALYIHATLLSRWGIEHGSEARVAMVYQHGILYIAETDEASGLQIHWNESGGGWIYVKTLLQRAGLLPFTAGSRVRCIYDVVETEEYPPVLRIDLRKVHSGVFRKNPRRYGEGEWEAQSLPEAIAKGG